MRVCVKSKHSAAFELALFDSLPKKPYCTDELGVTYIRQKKTAITKRYLQVNTPKKLIYLVFDIDRAGGVLAWHDNDLPVPLWTSKNPVNAHAHIAYRLKVPVCTSELGHLEPIKYLAAIQSAMNEKLKADRGFAGLLTKNPLHTHWQNTFWSEYQYSLDELADYLDLKGHPIKGVEAFGLGRNCELFENVRKWAYRAIREYWQPNYMDAWNNAVLERVEALNGQFIEPLPYSETRSIAKSIARWTYKHFTPDAFRKSQAKKGAKGSREDKAKAGGAGGSIGGVISKGGGRPSKKALLPQVLALKSKGQSNREIGKELNLGAATISRWLRSFSDPKVIQNKAALSDNSPF